MDKPRSEYQKESSRGRSKTELVRTQTKVGSTRIYRITYNK